MDDSELNEDERAHIAHQKALKSAQNRRCYETKKAAKAAATAAVEAGNDDDS